MAAVHKAGEERRFGATPATATPLPSSSRRSGDSVLIFRFGHTRRCPRLRALRVSGLAGTATPNAMRVLTFRFGDKKSRPRLRPLRSPELAGTARRSGWLVGFRISSGARQGGADVNGGGAELLALSMRLFLQAVCQKRARAALPAPARNSRAWVGADRSTLQTRASMNEAPRGAQS